MGFGVPLDHWFRNELKPLTHDLLLSTDTKSRQFFREEAVESLVQQHEKKQFDHSARLWARLCGVEISLSSLPLVSSRAFHSVR